MFNILYLRWPASRPASLIIFLSLAHLFALLAANWRGLSAVLSKATKASEEKRKMLPLYLQLNY